MRPPLLFLIFVILCASSAQGQNPPFEEPLEVIHSLFAAFRESDPKAVETCFHPDAQLRSVQNTGPGYKISEVALSQFTASLAGLPKGAADERIGRATVNSDGLLATVWMPYHFYLQGKFSHCGSNAFTLIKTPVKGWQILAITDSRSSSTCPELNDSLDLAQLDTMLNRWHRAAATADENTFFPTMSPDGIYLGTDASERWLRDEMAVWAAPFFQREVAWAFTPHHRQWYLSDDGHTAWFEEQLDSPHMGALRGSGVWTREAVYDAVWQLRHYNLALVVPNEKMGQVKAVIDAKD